MKHIDFVRVDRKKTGRFLQHLRNDNLDLRRYVCREKNLKKGAQGCDGEDCEKCQTYNMEASISQAELAEVMGVPTSQIANWENGKSMPDLEFLIFYCRLCNLPKIEDLIVLE